MSDTRTSVEIAAELKTRTIWPSAFEIREKTILIMKLAFVPLLTLSAMTAMTAITVMAGTVDCRPILACQPILNQNLNPSTPLNIPVVYFDDEGAGQVAAPLLSSTVITTVPPLDPAGTWNHPVFCPPPATAPEPGTIALMGAGIALLGVCRRKVSPGA